MLKPADASSGMEAEAEEEERLVGVGGGVAGELS